MTTDATGGRPAGEGSAAPGPTNFVILTGMSGAGRSTFARGLEDQGWYVVDNLPPQLLEPLGEIARQNPTRHDDLKVVAVIDVRTRGFFDQLSGAIGALREGGWRPQFVFLDASDETLVRRFESVRRPHPLQADGRMLDGIQKERGILGDLRAQADIVVDTSGFNVHQLTAKVGAMFTGDGEPVLRLAVMSFGFKYGIPLDADFVFDMRFLPNPYWVPELRASTGRDEPVARFVMAQPGAAEFVERVTALMEPVSAGYLREGRRYATIALGCTGGKHRSVAVAERVVEALRSDTVSCVLVHRDLGQE